MVLPSDLAVAATWYNPRKKRFWALLLLVSYTLAGFLLIPWIIKNELPSLAQNYLLRDARVQHVSFNPWSLRLEANQLELLDNDGSGLVEFDALVVNLQIRSIFQFALVFHEVLLQQPKIYVARYEFADTNVGRILDDLEAAEQDEAVVETEDTSAGLGLRLIIDNLNIDGGRIILRDEMPDTNFNTTLEPINISVTNLSTLPDKTGAQHIEVTTETGSSLKWTGSVQLNPLVSSGDIEISGSPLPLVYRYFKDQLGFRASDCCLDVELKYELASTLDGGIEAQVSDLGLSSRELELYALDSDGGDRLLLLPELRISGGNISWPEKTVRIGELLIDRPDINIWINGDGTLNLDKLLPPETPDNNLAANPAEQATLPAAESTADPSPGNQSPDWDFSLAALKVIGLQLGFEDRSLATPGLINVSDAEILADEISNRPEARSPFTIAARVGESGDIKLKGSVGLLPDPALEAELLITGLSIPATQPWAQQFASISINDGSLGLEGTLRSASTEQLELLADIRIDKLGISDTLENEALVGWNRLDLEQFRLQLDAGRLEISEVKLDQPFARLIIAQDGTTNFQSLALNESEDTGNPIPVDEQGKEIASPEEAAFVFQVGKTTIKKGSMDFSDFSLPLPFSAPISNFGGTLSALASDSRQASALDLEGQVGEYGLVKVGGSISVMAPTEQSDVNVDFRNIDMPDLSPYTAEFAGRKIDSGKLDLDLDYSFSDNKMVGENKIVLEKFQLGEKVDHPEAMSLPIDLAVGLLRDVNGVIDLQLNVSGDLDDPSFSASGIILKAFANLITKAAAAPFKLLGGLIPGGENVELNAVDFPAGRTDLAPPEREKLAQLAEALALRPTLQLSVPAGYNRDEDRRALQTLAVENQLNELLGNDTVDGQEMLTRRSRKAMEKLVQKQLPDLSIRELRKEFERETPSSDGSSFDEVAYLADLRLRLENVQAVDDKQLSGLAETRRTTIIDQLTDMGLLDPVQLKTADVVESDISDEGWVRVELSLELADEADSSGATDAQ